MVDAVTEGGLSVSTLSEIIQNLEEKMKSIYGPDINIDQNSPDGQLINIIAQTAVDLRELLVAINNSFDPDRAIGTLLDARVAINNITRKGGTFTTQQIVLTLDRTLTLQGLDADFNSINGTGYTVQDNAGNEFILIDTTTLTSGTHTLNFRAKQIGEVQTTPGTITSAVTVVLGVVSINNPDGALEIGKNEETDAELRIRRQQSVSLNSSGYLNSLLAAIQNLDGVTDAKLFENVTSSVDADGIPAHGMWLIVEGGANTDIAKMIYYKKSYGANQKGAVSVNIDTASGATFTAKFDRPTSENLHIRFDIQRKSPSVTIDTTAVKAKIVQDLTYAIAEAADTATVTATALSAIIQTSGAVAVPVNVEISKDGSTWFDYLTTTTKDKQFVLATTRITITIL